MRPEFFWCGEPARSIHSESTYFNTAQDATEFVHENIMGVAVLISAEPEIDNRIEAAIWRLIAANVQF